MIMVTAWREPTKPRWSLFSGGHFGRLCLVLLFYTSFIWRAGGLRRESFVLFWTWIYSGCVSGGGVAVNMARSLLLRMSLFIAHARVVGKA